MAATATAPTAPAAPQTKQGYVYASLRDDILRCTLAPGQRLVIEEIAGRLGVSPIPVREALRLLQSEGLIETVAHVGAIVAPITPVSVVETFTVLEGLELVSTRLAAERMTAHDHVTLLTYLDDMDAVLSANDVAAWGDTNTAFHGAIVRLTGLPLLVEMTERALGRWDRIRRFFAAEVLSRRAPQSQAEHREIVAAMAAGDTAALEALVKRHNQSATAAYVRHMDAHGIGNSTSNGNGGDGR